MQRHDVDSVSLTFGLIFVGIVNAWLMVETGAAEIDGLRWFFPVLLLGAGAAGVVSSLLRSRRPREDVVVDTSEGHP